MKPGKQHIKEGVVLVAVRVFNLKRCTAGAFAVPLSVLSQRKI